MFPRARNACAYKEISAKIQPFARIAAMDVENNAKKSEKGDIFDNQPRVCASLCKLNVAFVLCSAEVAHRVLVRLQSYEQFVAGKSKIGFFYLLL